MFIHPHITRQLVVERDREYRERAERARLARASAPRGRPTATLRVREAAPACATTPSPSRG